MNEEQLLLLMMRFKRWAMTPEGFSVNMVLLFFSLALCVTYLLKKNNKKQRVIPKTSSPQKIKEISEIREQAHATWLSKLHGGLAKTRTAMSQGLSEIFSGKNSIDSKMLEELHELLFRSDIGVKTADKLVQHVESSLKIKNNLTFVDLKQAITEKALDIFPKENKPFPNNPDSPVVILIVGVNGVGKTTTIGKLAAHFLSEEKSVLLCAADTFRAAAIDQLKIWGKRLDIEVIAHKEGADPAAVAFDGVKAAIARKSDVLLIDTAGRLHNKNHLMEELGKIRKVIGRDLPTAPHETLLVLDATVGQNAVTQVEAFDRMVPLSGILVTKLDGTAKGGVILGIVDKFQLPIRFIGVGEKVTDLRPFQANDFVHSMFDN